LQGRVIQKIAEIKIFLQNYGLLFVEVEAVFIG